MSNMREEALYRNLRTEWGVGADQDQLISVSQLLKRRASKTPDRIALILDNNKISYREFYKNTQKYAQLYREHGVQPGSHVLIYLNNSLEFYYSYFAAWHCGAVCVPLNIYLHAQEISGILADLQPKIIVTDTKMAARLAEPLENNTIGSERVITINSLNLADLDNTSDPENIAPEQTALILYTSGTSGVPKGVMLSSKNILTNSLQALTRFQFTVGASKHERFLAILPLFHVFAQNTCMWMPVLLGASVIVVTQIDRKLLLAGLQHKPTMFFGFPALYGLLVMMKTAPLNSIKLFVSGADAMPDKIRAAFALVYGRKICSGYGLTEAAPVVAVNISNTVQETHVVGDPLVGLTCEIRDDNGMLCDTDEIGTLWVKGDNIMQGYYRAPEQTARVLVDGFLNTGDLASCDNNGNIGITGRKKDLIINKGFNIYPQEVENILLRHPAVMKAAVIGKAEENSGEIPVAYISLREGYTLEMSEIKRFCNENLARYKVPRDIKLLDDLPMTATGKIDKKELRTRL